MLACARELDVQYKTAFVLAHKLREAVALAEDARVHRLSAADQARHGWPSRCPENDAEERVVNAAHTGQHERCRGGEPGRDHPERDESGPPAPVRRVVEPPKPQVHERT